MNNGDFFNNGGNWSANNQPITPYMPQNTFSSPAQGGLPGRLIRYEIARVKGREGALDFPMAPNSSIFLADETDPNRIWLVFTDGAGYKTIRPIDAKMADVPEENSLEQRIKRLEDLINDKFNSRGSKSKSTATVESEPRTD